MRMITQEDVTTRPLTENEKGWLRQRDRHAQVDLNEELFGRPVEADSDEREVGVGPHSSTGHGREAGSDGDYDNYDQWKIRELKEEGEARTPPVDFTGCTKKEDFVLAMRSWDLEHPETINEE